MHSSLQRRLAAGQLVVTGEIAPPKGAGREQIEKLAANIRHAFDAVNLTDNQRGVARMSALGAGVILQQMGIEPIVQMTCQHRNRIALQADLLSAVALGVHNFLCMTGDHPRIGDHPEAKNVLDVNSFQLIRMLRQMRDQRTFQAGTPLKNAPQLFS
ncbi:methylenetetrahydrofolate reductase, partial [Candidatus Gracilibacteria bacterium]|nr:methylenetetrahydrofolate reductase [Candidatus Gracilibacteria bacterium]